MPTEFGRLAMPSKNCPADEDLLVPFDIEMTDEAVYAYSAVQPDEVYARIGSLIDFLAGHPYYGEEYDPAYEAARPPIDCRVFFCARYGVYYHVDEERRLITVLAIENQRRNPMNRFSLIDD